MSDGVEAAGDIATGGLIARAVDRGGGAGDETHGACANCGTPLVGPHCYHCGQAAHVHRTLGAIGHDILHGVFHFEGKFWETLPLLAFRPGELTRRYIDGERVKFVSPIAMFLFTVFLMFAIVANLPGWSFGDTDLLKPGAAARMMETRTALAEEKAKAAADLKDAQSELAQERAEAQPDPARVARYERRITEATETHAGISTAERALQMPGRYIAKPARTDGNWFERKIDYARQNPKLLLYKVKTSAYKFSWALIPISLPFIWILFPFRRDVGMYDHAIFATYSLTFMSLMTITLALLGAAGVAPWLLWTAAFLIVPLHMYRQFKGTYRLSRAGALWRTFLMLNLAVVTSTVFIILLLYLGGAD